MAHKFRIVTTDSAGRWKTWIAVAVLAAVAVALVAFGGWWAYGALQGATVTDAASAAAHREQLATSNRGLARQLRSAQRSNEKLSEELAFLKRSREIDGDACKLVKNSLASLQQENSHLREQLAFYRGIVSPEQSAAGLRVYDFKVSRHGQAAREYDFELLLIQSLHHNRTVRGNAEVQVDGLQGITPKSYRLADLSAGKPVDLSFSFKYFQELSGHLDLPNGFRPIRVRVTLRPGDGQPDVTQVYSWTNVEQSSAEG